MLDSFLILDVILNLVLTSCTEFYYNYYTFVL